MICIAAVGGLARRVVVVLVALGLAAALVGCGGGGMSVDGPTATVPTLPPTTTDPYAVPAVIDEAYVNRVLAGLDQADGDVTRLIVVARDVPPEAVDRLKALYLGGFLQLRVDALQTDLFNRLAGYKPIPGNVRTTVSSLITVRASCIFAQVNRDLSDVVLSPDPRLHTQWVALVPLDPSKDPHHYNRTSWVYIYDGFQKGFSQPEDPCAKLP